MHVPAVGSSSWLGHAQREQCDCWWHFGARCLVRSARAGAAGAQVVGIDSGTVMLRLQVSPPPAIVQGSDRTWACLVTACVRCAPDELVPTFMPTMQRSASGSRGECACAGPGDVFCSMRACRARWEQGACGTCPSSAGTMKMGIERALKARP